METLQWLEKKHASPPKKDIPLREFLYKELEATVGREEEAYAEALGARSQEEKHASILAIVKARSEAPGEPEEDTEEEKEPRKKGFLERSFDELCESYLADPTESKADRIMGTICQLEINRRVRFYYDLQKLRIGAGNRREMYKRVFGISDTFIDYSSHQLERLENQNEKMVHRILMRSPDAPFYEWLRDNHLGVGVMMAGCIIAELSAPERFHSVSALWSYCGLAVVGNSEEGRGGHAQRRQKGERACWNHFLKTKLLGVLTGTMIKAQTRHIGTEMESSLARNVKTLHGYKARLHTINDLIPESERHYNEKGKEIFSFSSTTRIETYDKDRQRKTVISQNEIKRRSPKHIQMMSQRYMIKMFLADILNQWRVMKGFKPFLTYDEAKLRGGVQHQGLDLRPNA